MSKSFNQVWQKIMNNEGERFELVTSRKVVWYEVVDNGRGEFIQPKTNHPEGTRKQKISKKRFEKAWENRPYDSVQAMRNRIKDGGTPHIFAIFKHLNIK